jgi:N utilization substance protein B
MGYRRKSRELALQALFYMDMSNDASEETLQRFCNNFNPPEKIRPFFFRLVQGVRQCMSEIDKLIERFSKNWQIGRMSCVDRNVLRIAVYELLCCSDIPPKVSINEAIDIGKKFGTEESGAFINGIIDSIRIAQENDEIQIDLKNQKSKVELE